MKTKTKEEPLLESFRAVNKLIEKHHQDTMRMNQISFLLSLGIVAILIIGLIIDILTGGKILTQMTQPSTMPTMSIVLLCMAMCMLGANR